MRICRYFNEYGLDVLKNFRLKVTDPTSFNDPFEFLPAIKGNLNKKDFNLFWNRIKESDDSNNLNRKLSQKYNLKNGYEFKQFFENISADNAYENFKIQYPIDFRSIINETRKELGKTLRVVCFCNFDLLKPQEDILLWGHYTNNHSGLRITFDKNKIENNFRKLLKIEYKKQRNQIDVNDIINHYFSDNKNIEEKIEISLKEKCDLWSYEHECRLLVFLNECERINEKNSLIDYISVPPDSILRVDIGINAKDDLKKEILETINKNEYSRLEMRFAQIDDIEFKLNYTKML